MIIAIDGPAASGKGTIARRLAEHYGFPHLDTGLLYRAVAKAVLDAGYELDDRARVIEAALGVDPSQFDEAQLKTHAVGEAASIVAAIPDVRAALFNFQQEFAAAERGAVLLELRALGQDAREADVLADILRRDERDRSRTVAPLRPAEDAHVLDTTKLDIEGAVAAAITQVERVRA
jgi:CMP/dCMP kinase